MKHIVFSFFAVIIITSCTPAEDKKSIVALPFEEFDVAKEEVTIKKVVQSALDAIVAKDYDAYVVTWVHSPYIERRGVVGWDSLSVFYQKSFNDPPEYFQARVITASNFDIYINGNFASVFHEEHFEGIIEGEEITRDGRVHKYLEKIEGEWRVITVF
jgi:hypothetical protein